MVLVPQKAKMYIPALNTTFPNPIIIGPINHITYTVTAETPKTNKLCSHNARTPSEDRGCRNSGSQSSALSGHTEEMILTRALAARRAPPRDPPPLVLLRTRLRAVGATWLPLFPPDHRDLLW